MTCALYRNNVKDISQRDKISELLVRTKYNLTLSTGQRRYGGPPPHWEGPPPGSGESKFCSQIHIGKLARTIFEDILVPVLETCGRIYQLRIMVNPLTGENKGFAFADFFTKEEAQKFIDNFNEKPLRDGELPITAKLTIPNCRIFVGGFATNKCKEEVERELSVLFENATDVKAFPSTHEKKRNRGYAFITFSNHNDANQARKKLRTGKIQVFNQVVRDADWAENVDPSDDGDVRLKTIFVRFGTSPISEETLKSLFEPYGKVIQLDKLQEYAFIELETEEAALNAINGLNNKEVEGITLLVSHAKSNKDGAKRRKYMHMGRDNQDFNTYHRDSRRYRHPERNPRAPYRSSPHRSPDGYFYEEQYSYYPERYPRCKPQPYMDSYANEASYSRYPPNPYIQPLADMRQGIEYGYPEAPHQPYNPHIALDQPNHKSDNSQSRNVNWGHGAAPLAHPYNQNPSYMGPSRFQAPPSQYQPQYAPSPYTPTLSQVPPTTHNPSDSTYSQSTNKSPRPPGNIKYW
ncbi:hypothetical protein MXB_3603 [Myxobolus squamalis]|nr:hypothetical protein MXB_3603 [Myxobolus squamalis]